MSDDDPGVVQIKEVDKKNAGIAGTVNRTISK
jgi:hypothetical protein